MIHSRQAVLAGALGTAIAITVGCTFPAPPGGGVIHESRPCVTQGNNYYNSEGFGVKMVEPPCPYTVSASGQTILFAFKIGAYAAYVNGAFTGGNVYNEQKVLIGGTGAGGFVFTQVADSTTMDAEPYGKFEGGTGSPIKDSAAMFVTGTPNGVLVQFGVNMPGDISTAATTIIGGTTAVVGTSSPWRAQSYWDTTMYTFNWYVDGTLVSSGAPAALSHNFASDGVHSLRVVTVLGSGVTDTTTENITVLPAVTWTGPTSLLAGSRGTWTATGVGGTTPYKYAWYKNGTLISSTASASVTAPVQGGEFDLSVNATDAHGYEGSTFFYVQVTCPGGAATIGGKPLGGQKVVGGASPDLCTG